MAFFFIVPLWILCLLGGATLFCFARLRNLSLYVLLGSTGFAVFSLLCSTMVLLVAGKWPQLFWHSGLLVAAGYIGALLAGGGSVSSAGWRLPTSSISGEIWLRRTLSANDEK
jgi:hypothetical protein